MILEKKETIKAVFVGGSGSGKTCLIKRFFHPLFDNSYTPTIGTDFKIKLINDGKKIIQFWDTSGQERFSQLILNNIKDADVVILVYEFNSKVPDFEYWNKAIAERADSKSVLKILVANKSEVADKIEEEIVL